MTEISFNRLKEAIPKRPIDWNESEFHLSLDFFKLNEFKYKLRIKSKKYIIIYILEFQEKEILKIRIQIL